MRVAWDSATVGTVNHNDAKSGHESSFIAKYIKFHSGQIPFQGSRNSMYFFINLYLSGIVNIWPSIIVENIKISLPGH